MIITQKTPIRDFVGITDMENKTYRKAAIKYLSKRLLERMLGSSIYYSLWKHSGKYKGEKKGL
jgi:hypothetical protein